MQITDNYARILAMSCAENSKIKISHKL